jgi:hypothetical protein
MDMAALELKTIFVTLFHTEPDAVAFLTRLAGKFSVKDPKENFVGLTRTALDVGGRALRRSE